MPHRDTMRRVVTVFSVMALVLVLAGTWAVNDVRKQSNETRARQLSILRSLNSSCKVRNGQLAIITAKDERLLAVEKINKAQTNRYIVQERIKAYQAEIERFASFTDADCDR